MNMTDKLTDEERNAVEELKRRTITDVTPKMLEDETLFYRFCKARDFKVAAAEVMLKNHIRWREEHEIDTILTDFELPEVVAKYCPARFIGFDKEGSPVRDLDVGAIDFQGFASSLSQKEMFKSFAYALEKDFEAMRQNNEKTGKHADTMFMIIRLENLTLAIFNKKNIEIFAPFCSMFQNNFPERAKFIFLINAYTVLPLVFPFLRAVFASGVFAKIHCFGKDNWKEKLLEKIDAVDLPVSLGGNKPDSYHPYSKTLGQKVPEIYYQCNQVKNLSSTADGVKLTIKRSSSKEVSFQVEQSESSIEWEFETADKDIGFGIYFRDNSLPDTEIIELFPIQRIHKRNEAEKGVLKCQQIGIYSFVFDNSYSWFHQKVIYFRATIRNLNDERKRQTP